MATSGLSARKMAKDLQINVTTLTRSLHAREFSSQLADKLNNYVSGDFDDPISLLHKALLILQEADSIRNEVEKTVLIALKRLEASR